MSRKIKIELKEKKWRSCVISALELLEDAVINDLERHKEVYETKKEINKQLPKQNKNKKSPKEKARDILEDYD